MKNRIIYGAMAATVGLAGFFATSCDAAEDDKGFALTAPSNSNNFLLSNVDRRIMFLGDSITEQRSYTTMIESYVLSRFPTWDVTFRNVGWSGDATSLYARGGYEIGMQRDILAFKPGVVLINFGMNDARGGANGLGRYIDYSTRLTRDIKKSGSRVILLTPSPEERYEKNQPGGSAYNNTLLRYSNGLKTVASQENVPFVDQITPFLHVIASGRKARVLDPMEGGVRLIPDAVHPNSAGHLVMAASILKGMNAPALVSSISLKAESDKLSQVNARNAEVEILPTSTETAATSGTLTFKRTDEALPWPIPEDASPALQIPGYTPLEDLSRYELQVSNLAKKRYEIRIDGDFVGAFTREELAKGLNLTRRAGPITTQTRALFDKIVAKNNLFFNRWRSVQLYQAPSWLKGDVDTSREAELSRLDAEIAATETEINALRRPATHTWTLTPATPTAPSDLQMKFVANGVNLSWKDTSDDEEGFYVERSSDGKTYTRVATLKANARSYRDAGVSVSQPLYYRVRSFNTVGSSTRAGAVSNAWKGVGLRGEYFRGTNFETLLKTRVDSLINFDGTTFAPTEIGPENFSVRWTGQVEVPESGDYILTARTDDGVRVWINGKQVIDNWRNQGPTDSDAKVFLDAGQRADIRVDYYQGGGGATAQLFWARADDPATKRELVPTNMLYPASVNSAAKNQ
jgi:lysophospholipase L1-like esterase